MLNRARAGRGRDEGAATTILVVGMALVLVAATLVFSRIAQANDLRTKAQTAADAAALGALAPLRDQAVNLALDGISPTGIAYWLTGAVPETSAREYAEKNANKLVGKVHMTGLLGTTAKVETETKDCQLKKDNELTPKEKQDLQQGHELCTDASGKKGIGRSGNAVGIAKVFMPDCFYQWMPGGGGETPLPARLICAGVQVWPGGDHATVTRLFKVRLVDKEDPVAYTGAPFFDFSGPLPDLPDNVSDLVRKIISYAIAQVGKPYVWGAEGPDTFDCSGLVMAAYRAAGVPIPRTTFTQWPFGVHVPNGSEQPGDLVFFAGSDGTMSQPGHVGLVVDPVHHTMIEAACTACTPGVRSSSYERSDLVGFTRPLARFGKQ
jgi:hypothetical protein